ncbi:MAG: MoxR family ATPase [Planctomycetota bacterium]|jgi:MoxR-like ATPase|nr:MoxR family ATPase [Planctomycetota bacterium]MDP7133749.1 MoxR family ATPase [Planctomycetota bacterium]MDP7253740.1 MoxR family ATPase [Planctomycetota bacterium]
MSAEPQLSDKESVDRIAGACQRIRGELSKIIVGQDEVIEELLTAIFARGHCLLEGVPGLAKTLMISSLAKCMHLDFRRIQFTPDLMPSDITGTEILQDDPETGERRFKFLQGPLFTNILLADEINRTPPKTQAALLEAMQERKVSVGGEDFDLEPPFFVLATQNPIEQEGTYRLPEAQLDRFLYKVVVRYPTKEEEVKIVKQEAVADEVDIEGVLTRDDVLEAQNIVRHIVVADSIVDYATELTRATRPKEEESPGFIRELLSWGAGPRASMYLITSAKARAVLQGRYHVALEDVQAVAAPVLRHRIVPNFSAQSQGLTPDDIVLQLIEEKAGS